jgi:hypothetical protein
MFIPRHPVVENQFCSYGAQTSVTTGIGGVVAYAGSVVYLDSTADNEEAIVFKMASGKTPFGFLMQKVKTGYHQVHPSGFVMPGDLGSSDAIAQPSYSSVGAINGTKAVPVGVAHLGIYDTVHYTSEDEETALLPSDTLYAAYDEAKVTNNSTDYAAAGDGGKVSSTSVARVMKGASAAKATANIANTTLYPIRIKLLI